MNARRTAAWAAGILALLVAAGGVALRTLVDPDRLKAAALEHARTTWERELLIGDVSLAILPLPAFEATKVSFSNPPWSEDPHLLQADYVRADLALLPLLTGEVRVKSLEMEGVHARLEEGEDGRASWELRSGDGKRAGDARFQVDAVLIRNLTIHHRARAERAEPWHVAEARIASGPGYRNVRIDVRVARHGQPLEIHARFDDLSKAGRDGAASDGRIELRWAKTQATVQGAIPVGAKLRGGAVRGHVKSESLQDVFAFFGIERGPTAALEMRLDARESGGRLHIGNLSATLGALKLAGDGTAGFEEGKPVVHARLRALRLDWLETLVDAGGEVKPKRRNEEIFHDDPVAWRVVETLGALDGSTAELQVDSLRLGNGLELRDVASRVAMGKGRVRFGPSRAALLGGSAKGTFDFDANRRTIRATLDGDRLSLEQWFRQRGSKVPFSGGPLRIDADLTLAGETYRELAASLSGPLRLRMGPGTWNSKRAGEYEELMVDALAARDSGEIRFACAAARLDFKSGRASGERLLGARSDVSRLLTGGAVDFRKETLDLRGQVRAASGPSVGLAMFAGDVQVHGRLARPKMRLDPERKPAIIARAAAAIATTGATLLGGALIDAAEAKDDPCKAVFGAD